MSYSAESAAPPRASWIAFHTRIGSAGMSMWVTPSGESASMMEFMTAGGAPMVPGLPHALDPERVARRRRYGPVQGVVRQLRGSGDHVVHHRTRGERAVLVVDGSLIQRLGDALGETAV